MGEGVGHRGVRAPRGPSTPTRPGPCPTHPPGHQSESQPRWAHAQKSSSEGKILSGPSEERDPSLLSPSPLSQLRTRIQRDTTERYVG